MMNNTSVDSYLAEGCGRCDKYQTPECKVHFWTDALIALRELLQDSELDEEMKWGSPCYTLNGKNVILLFLFKEFCALSFLKGAGLDDPADVLELPGPNSRYGRLLKFTSFEEVDERRPLIKGFIEQAIEFERSGKKIEIPDDPDPMPEELEERLDADAELAEAFEALTPGRKRSYFIYISGAKQAETRERRVERCLPKILDGKGYNER